MAKILNLDELIDPTLQVVLDGETVPLKPVDGVGLQLLSGMTPESGADVFYKVAMRCLPTVSEARVMSMTPVQVGAIVKMATEGVEAVEALASPNSGPAGTRTGGRKPFSPGSRRKTR